MKKKFLSILLSTCLILTGCGSTAKKDTSSLDLKETTDPYTINNSYDYVREGQTCQNYNVITDGELTDSELQTIYQDIKDNNNYLYYTIHFYSHKDDVATASFYATIDDETNTDIIRE